MTVENGTDTVAPPLDASALLAEAIATTGLDDWGDASFPERFGLAVAQINAVQMGDAGRAAAADNCRLLLENRLQFFADRERYPIGDEVIDRPMFATGEPRSGTTLMHALMSVDPHARALRFWELRRPSPPPGLAANDDPRRAEADDEWRQINTKLWKWLQSHPYNDMLGNGLPEDERAWNIDFRVMTPSAWWRVPMRNMQMGLPTRGLPAEPRVQYRIHRMMLQQLQYARPPKYWVLKGFHGFRLGELFDEYPDATIVWLHRDPVQVAASSTMMVADIQHGIVGPIDLLAEAKLHVERVRTSVANTMSNPLVDDSRIQHVRYRDFVADPIGTIRGYYEFAGRTLTDKGEAAMRQYLEDNPGDRHGKFQYSTQLLTDAGFDLDVLDEEFAAFRERFGVEREARR